MKALWTLTSLVFITLCSCSNSEVKLVIQNISAKDSLAVVVSVNGKQIFNNYVEKATANTAATTSKIYGLSKNASVEVQIPALNLKEKAISNIGELGTIFITVRSVTISTLPAVKGDLTSIPKKEEILIAFFDRERKGVGY